jgi:hypothetical protein
MAGVQAVTAEVVGIRAHVCDADGCERAPAFVLAVIVGREIAVTLACGEHELDRRAIMYRRGVAYTYGFAPVHVFARRVHADEVLLVPEIRAWLAGELLAEFHAITHLSSQRFNGGV